MSRLITAGAESGHIHPENVIAGGTVSFVSSPVRSGNLAYSISYATASNTVGFNFTAVSGRWFYSRVWLHSTGLPTSARQIATIYQTTIPMRVLYQHPDGTISSNSTYGLSPHSAPVPINEWHCLEIGVMSDGTNLSWILRLDGTQFSSLSTAISQNVNRIRFGASGGATDSSTMYFDDIALNDDQGANQNSWPDIRGQIVVLTPSNDLAVGANWVLGQGGAPSGLAYDSVNNTPPLGVANNAVGADPKQIRNAVASVAQPAADADLKCPAYSSIVPAGNAVKVLLPIFELGQTSASATPDIEIGLLSNPTQLLTVTLPVGAAGNFASLWNRFVTDVIYNPSVALSDQAVLRIGRRTATALTQVCCFAGLMVEYELLPPAGGQKFLAVA